MALRALCLCDGYGGFELGLREHGIRTVARVERDSYAAAVLVERMEQERLDQAPVWDDLTTFDGAGWRGCVDLITAGFPCQPFSTAGQRKGVDDDRWLWPVIGRIIRDVGPRFVFLENVPGLVRGGLPHVLSDLADLGFDAEWGLLSASDVGAPHKRQRFWLLALAHDDDVTRPERRMEQPGRTTTERASEDVGHTGREGRSEVSNGASRDEGKDGRQLADSESARRDQRWRSTVESSTIGRRGVAVGSFPPRPDDIDGWRRWIETGGPEPSVRRSNDGPPVGLADSLHLGGNGLVPQCAGEAFRQLLERLGVTT